MTKKLKRKVKKIALTVTGSLLSITALGAIGTRLISMPKANIDKTLVISSENSNNPYTGEVEIITGSNKSAPMALSGANIASDGAILCDSLVQGARDNDLADGNYTFRVTGKTGSTTETKNYAVELINFYDNVTYSLSSGQTEKTISLGDTTTTYKTLIVKYHKNLTIDKGVTVTATNVSDLTYKKGMYLCVMGELVNNGTISMTARGTYNLDGENVYLWKNIDETYEYVPAVGGKGGTAVNSRSTGNWWAVSNGNAGANGTNRATGGGGSGASANWSSSGTSGAGGAGTSYTGGGGRRRTMWWTNEPNSSKCRR